MTQIIDNGSITGENVKVYRRGNDVTLVFEGAYLNNDLVGWQTTVCTLPSEYAPGYGFYFGGTDDKTYYMDSAGKILCTTATSKDERLFATVTFVRKQ